MSCEQRLHRGVGGAASAASLRSWSIRCREVFATAFTLLVTDEILTMFHTSLDGEYENAARMGLNEEELRRLVAMSFEYACNRAACCSSSWQSWEHSDARGG